MAYPFLTVIARQALIEIFAQGSLIYTVNRDFEGEVSAKGESVTVIMPETPPTQDAGGAFNPVAVNPTTVTLKLDKWKETQPLSVDMKTLSLANDNVLAKYSTQIAESIRSEVEAAILAALGGFTEITGDAAGTKVPTGVAGVGVTPKLKFDALKAPLTGRFVVAGPSLETEYWKAFVANSQAGDIGVQEQIRGVMGNRLTATYISNAAAEDGVRLGFGYHKNAVALASRPMQVSPMAQGMVTENYMGLGLTIEAWHDPSTSKDYLRGQVLYGIKALTSKGFQINKEA